MANIMETKKKPTLSSMRDVEQSSTVFLLGGCLMNFYKKLGEIRPNQLITTYGPGSIMDAVMIH